MNYYRQYPNGIDKLNRIIGYRLRPAWIWTYGDAAQTGLIVGLANDGISGIPGVVRLTLLDQNSTDPFESVLWMPAYPVPHQVRSDTFELPAGTGWQGTRLKAELIVKGMHPFHPLGMPRVTPSGWFDHLEAEINIYNFGVKDCRKACSWDIRQSRHGATQLQKQKEIA